MPGELTPSERVRAAYRSIATAERPEVWIQLRGEQDALDEAAAVETRVSAGAELPLAGMTVAVKDNIDVAGLETTAACPAFAYQPAADAPTVARLRAAGAIVIGKTNMDQFATGLTGTRSPYGAVRDARDSSRVSGGSSSGSAVSVALGLADLALGTDTAGSGRVPAAFQGVFGVKPTRGLVPIRGVVPAARSFDCVSLFARDLVAGQAGLSVIAGVDPGDHAGRRWPFDAPLAAPPAPRIGIARRDQLELLSPDAHRALADVLDKLSDTEAVLVEIDIEPLLSTGALLYGGAFVAERFAAFGSFIVAHPDDADPTVAEIVLAARSIPAERYIADLERLAERQVAFRHQIRDLDALLLPTTPGQPTIREVAADPLEVNRRIGTYATFCNLLDLCAVAVPAGEADRGQFGVTVFASAFHEHVVLDLAARITAHAGTFAPAAPAVSLLVLGAHMSGGPLNHELILRGGRLLRTVRTASCYRLLALDMTPAKPGLVRVAAGDAGASIEGEVWALPPAGLASLLAELPQPMTLGSVALEDGSEVVGFLCEPVATQGNARDITEYGGWRAFQAAIEAHQNR